MTQEQETVLEKVKKLLALATSPVPAEAALAMAKAHELMLRYNVNIQDIKEDGLKGYGEMFVNYDFALDTKYIHNILQRFFFVDILVHPHKKQWSVLGKTVNCEMAIYMNTHIRHKFHQAWMAYKEENNLPGITGKTDFYYGMNRGLVLKLETEKTRLGVEEGLIVVKDPKIAELKKEKYGKTGIHRSGNQRLGNNQDHIAAGHQAGREMQLNHGLRDGSTKGALRLGN